MLPSRWSTSLSVAALAAFAFLSPAAISADLSQAVVRQKVNVVTVAASINASAQPVSQGAVVRDENVVRTGTESRAELEFGDLTLARLGANSIFTFDAEARAMNCMQGAALFSKPTNSGRVEVRAGAITAAITGSTGFISNQPTVRARKGRAASNAEERTAMMGMLEGKLRGSAVWRDNNGKERTFRFALGAGEMIVAQPGRAPVVVQFDIPRFLSTSPLITGFSGTLPNMNQINRTVAEYQADERRGFIQRTNVMVSSQPVQVAWLNASSVNRNSFDASVDQLGHSGSRPGGEEGGFVDVGGTGVIRGQLVWNTSADLDLHLILPDNQEVFFANQRVTFNNGRATAE
ncbi:MAG: FecR family protein, partial [Verrucomicrobiota bacterium]|nr:FecR family protein [Verrucomicrobiota bacterium]